MTTGISAAIKRYMLKHPGSDGHPLTSTQGMGVCRQVTHGIMEWWKNGILGIKSG